MVELRNFTNEDAETLRQLHYCDMTSDAIMRMIRDWNRLEYRGKYFEMFAVVGDGRIVGELSLYELSKSIVSIGIEIYPEFQRRGFGKQAIGSALQICKKRGFQIVFDQVRMENAPSIALHKSAGFESDLCRYQNQRGNDVYLFLKTLDNLIP